MHVRGDAGVVFGDGWWRRRVASVFIESKTSSQSTLPVLLMDSVDGLTIDTAHALAIHSARSDKNKGM